MNRAGGDQWEFWIDRGGTFTDVVAHRPDGGFAIAKLLSDNDGAYDDAAVEGVRRLMGVEPGAHLPSRSISAVKMGTTVATNALLERRGAKTVFITTRGFADALEIGDQTRPDIFALEIHKPAPLAAMTIEADERLNAAGELLLPLDQEALKADLAAAREAGCVSAAICFLHGYREAYHEIIAAQLAEAAGFEHITISSEVDPLIRFVPRARTTLADAYLTPAVQARARAVSKALGGAKVQFMTSAGGLVSAEAFRGRDALLSGPAGGVVGMAKTAAALGYRRVIGFDMGGTSTDVSRVDGRELERLDSAPVGDWRVRAPMVAVHTVAAGGGSILNFDGERARVGPESAGADPGPACYGRGGPLTVTDANVLLGRIDSRFFPEVFGSSGDQPLNIDIVRRRFAKLGYSMAASSSESAAEGFLSVAVENMAQAVKRISLAQGYDPAAYALQSFGGAGGQVACRVAEVLSIRTVLVHPMASVMSALGIGLAGRQVWREASVEETLDGNGSDGARRVATRLETDARAELIDQGAALGEVHVGSEARLRYHGADTALPVPLGQAGDMRGAFEAAHRRLFGFVEPERELVIESVRVEARTQGLGGAGATNDIPLRRGGPWPVQLSNLYVDGEWLPCPVYRLSEFGIGAITHGPALIVDAHSQTVVDHGWRASRRNDGFLVLERLELAAEDNAREAWDPTALDPARLELFNQRFMSVAEQMGVTLERTAHSVNIKERLDFSCAVFDAQGGLVANAPHMPVHLGSMGASVRATLETHPDIGAGDAVVLNNPYRGGTHLPDVTVIMPVHDRRAGGRMFFVAARGHHADVGGSAPGSMPPFSTSIEDEGVVIDGVKILSDGVFLEAAAHAAFMRGSRPSRTPDRNIADLKAQLAACARGAEELQRLIDEHGRQVVRAYMGHVQNNAEAAVRRVLSSLPDGDAEVLMDDGSRINVSVTVDRTNASAVIDFAGTSPQQNSNINAPAAITRAAVLYVFRCLVGDEIPLNDGCLKPLDIRIPPRSLLDPVSPAAVVAGNVETSQHVVDALFLAVGASAASQGTMNNLTFGDDARQYYETISGGAGAGPTYDGADAVHTHMTNSRLTDPEIFEQRHPVLVDAHRVRRNSGGFGARTGGDGGVRRLRFLEPMDVALLSFRRSAGAPGLMGGEDGEPGTQRLVRATGRVETLEGRFTAHVEPGDVLVIETPGGGGWGVPARGLQEGVTPDD